MPVFPGALQAQEVDFDIPEGAMVDMVPAFARQAGIQIVGPASGASGIRTGAVQGKMDVRVALGKVLAKTGYRIALDDGDTIVLRPAGVQVASLASADDLLSMVPQVGPMPGAVNEEQQKKPNEIAQLDAVSVTGSRLKRAEVEGPNPVTTISRSEIQASGEVSIADFLRNNVYNSFGSAKESTDTPTSSASTISLRGMGAQYTLILLDGRRMTNSPSLSGGAANINLIPSAAVDRIEILRDGAGAIYGSDAIGGVVNIILRKDYQGMTLSGGYDSPDVGADSKTANLSGGISSDKGSIAFVVDHQERGMTYNREIKDKVLGAGLAWGLSSSNSSAGFLGSNGLVGTGDCDSHENSVRNGAACGYDHGATSAYEADMKRDSAMLSGTYFVTDSLDFVFRAISSDVESWRVYAASPVQGMRIAADNPYNPFGEAGTLYYRYVLNGTRDTLRRDKYRDVLLGLKGRSGLLGGLDWELGVGHGRVTQDATTYGVGLTSVLQAKIDAGVFDPFDPTNPVNRAAAAEIDTTSLINSEQRTVSADGNISFTPFVLPAGDVGLVLGFDYRDDRLSVVYDSQTAAGNVFGMSGSSGLGGARAYHAFYFEAGLPLLANWNMTVAGRYDSYNDFGGNFSPRLSTEFRPGEAWLIRGSWGEGFRAPTLEDLYGSSTKVFNTSPALESAGLAGGDALACQALQQVRANTGNSAYQPYPVDPCTTQGQYQWLQSSNRYLDPEESSNWGVGVVWSPSSDLSASLDYYDIKLDNVIATVPYALAFAFGDQGVPGYGVDRGAEILAPDGSLLPGVVNGVLLPVDNGAQRRIRGVDAEFAFGMDTDWGRFQSKLTWTHQFQYDFTNIDGSVLKQAGTAGYPDDRAQLALGWQKTRYGAALNVSYIDRSGSGATAVASYTTIDLQGKVELPWKARLALGVRNLGDRDPPFNSNVYDFPYYDNSMYSIAGRIPYVRYEQDF